jgi:hypothetical protein
MGKANQWFGRQMTSHAESGLNVLPKACGDITQDVSAHIFGISTMWVMTTFSC